MPVRELAEQRGEKAARRGWPRTYLEEEHAGGDKFKSGLVLAEAWVTSVDAADLDGVDDLVAGGDGADDDDG